MAPQYEEAFGDELDRKPYDRDLLDRFAAAVRDPVLEIGSGPGQIGAYVRDRGRRVIATDFSVAMTHRAARRVDSAAAADFRFLPIRDGSVGALIGFYCVIHIPRGELSGALREFCRVLCPGGRLLISAHEGEGEISAEEFLGTPVPFIATLYSLDELVDAAEAAAMEVTLAERRPPYDSEHSTVRLYMDATRRT